MTDEPKKIVIDMAGVMGKLTPEMFDAAKDAMIEALIKGGTEWRNRAEAAEAKLAAPPPSPDVAALVEALEPFAQEAGAWIGDADDQPLVEAFPSYAGNITVGDCRRAAAALAAYKGEKE